MTALLALLSCLLFGLLITQLYEYIQLKRLVLNLAARLEQQNELLTRLAAAAERPAELLAQPQADRPEAGPADDEEEEPEPAREPGPPEVVETRGTEEAEEAKPPAPPLWPSPAPGPARRRFGAAEIWPTLAALLVLALGAGFLIWFSLTLGPFPPTLRLGALFLAGLTGLILGLLCWEKRPRLGLAAEGSGLWLMGLALAGATRFPGLLALGPGRAALAALGLFGAILALKQNSSRLTLLMPPAFFGLWAAMSPHWAGFTPAAAGAGLFYLALNLAVGRSDLAARRLVPYLALASLNLALVSRLFAAPLMAPLENLSPWAGLSLAWTLESVFLFRRGHWRLGALSLGLAAACAPLIPDLFSGALVSQFFMSAAALGGGLLYAASRTDRSKTALILLGLGAWLAGSLASVWGAVTAFAESSFILNWLLAAWSIFSLGLWLAGRAAPHLLTKRHPGSPPLLVLAQALSLIPALILALGFLRPLLGAGENPGEFNPAAWALWGLAQGLGLAQARRLTPVAAWSNAFLLALALALSQAATVLSHPAFGQDLVRLAGLLCALAFFVRPPRLALFQELSLCRAAGLILSCLALWKGLVLALDPANRPGFFGFLPVFNLTDLLQAATFWLPLAFLRRLTASERSLGLLQGILFFLWLNLVLARAVHHLAGVPYQMEALLASKHFLIVCAGVWGALGLGAWLADRRRKPTGPGDH